MRLIPCQSGMLSGLAIDNDDGLLAQFKNGDVYRYRGVPAEVVLSVLFDPESQGAAFIRLIRNGVYPFQKITDPYELGLHV